MGLLAAIGRVFISFLAATGRLAVFAGISVSHIVRPPFYPRLLLRQIIEIGYYSLPVVGLTAVFKYIWTPIPRGNAFSTTRRWSLGLLSLEHLLPIAAD